ncbi:MAG: phosphatidate cytidylyltransferase [Ferruginibacter sp.]
MKHLKLMSLSFLLLCMSAMLSSCEAIKGIFKAGMWTGVLIVVGIIGLVIFFISRGKK